MTLYSHSRLSTYEQCPYQYKLKYIDKIKTEKETIEAFLGSRVHDTLEWLYRQVNMEKIPSLKEVLKKYKEKWEKEFNDSIKITKDFSVKNYYDKGVKFIKNYYEKHKPFDENTIDIEKRIVVNLDDKGKYKLVGYIDRLVYNEKTGEYEIHDYKTNNKLKTQENLNQDKQLALYSIAINDMYPDTNKICLVWHFLAFDKEFCSYRNNKEIEKLKKDTIKIIKEIENHIKSEREWKPKKSNLCNWCDYQDRCPKFKHKKELEEKSVKEFKQDDGVKLVNNLAEIKNKKKELEKQEDKLKEDLIEFSKQQDIDIIYGSDAKASVKDYDKIALPKGEEKKDFINLIKKKGLWDNYSTLNFMKLNSDIIKNNIDKEIKDKVDIEKGWKVYLSKKK